MSSLCSAHQNSKPNKVSHKNPTQTLRLSLLVRADRSQFRMNGAVRVEVQLTNIGDDTLYLFDDVCWNPANFLTVRVFDMHGKEVSGHSDFLRDCLPPPPARDDTSRFFKLEPGTFYGVVEKFKMQELVPGPGEYSVVVQYVSAISKDWVSEYGGEKMAALPIWTRDYPELSSNRLHMVVKP